MKRRITVRKINLLEFYRETVTFCPFAPAGPKSTEAELIVQYLAPSAKGEGEFMTATDILRYLQEIVGTTIRLNTKLVGSALREAGFDRVAITNKYGYWVLRRLT